MEKNFIGIVKDDLKSLESQYTGKFATYKEAHEAAEALCKKTLGDRGSIKVVDITPQYKKVGNWWNDSSIEQIKKGRKTYALAGWNGESYFDSWQVLGDGFEGSEEEFIITPIYEQIGEDDFVIVDYKIRSK